MIPRIRERRGRAGLAYWWWPCTLNLEPIVVSFFSCETFQTLLSMPCASIKLCVFSSSLFYTQLSAPWIVHRCSCDWHKDKNRIGTRIICGIDMDVAPSCFGSCPRWVHCIRAGKRKPPHLNGKHLGAKVMILGMDSVSLSCSIS